MPFWKSVKYNNSVEIDMYYSYAMGIGENIYSLKDHGFIIKRRDSGFQVSFPKEKAKIWEDFVMANLEINYWNEYLTEDGVVFIFNLCDGIRRYDVKNFDNEEVLTICEELCDCDFGTIKDMLIGNKFYRKILAKKDIK